MWLMVSEKIFKFFPDINQWNLMTPGEVNVDPNGLIGKIYPREIATYFCEPHGFREEISSHYKSMVTLDPKGRACLAGFM